MNKIKVNDFINAYSRALNLNEETKNVLTELMENIIQKYEKIIPYIPTSMDSSSVYLIKPVDGKYSVEDFFLNRLMRNVWSVMEVTPKTISDGFSDGKAKGDFRPEEQTISFNSAKLSNQVEKYRNVLGNNFDKMKSAALKKVIMHEFEHALQTRYDNKLEFRFRQSYKKISDEISKLKNNSSQLQTYDDIPKSIGDASQYISCGTHFSTPAANSGIKTYKNIDGYDNLNEILNESESLEMAGQQTYLTQTLGVSGNMFYLRNPESSNFEITNYGDLFKMLLGERESFKLMYLNPVEGFEIFNGRYNDVFQSMYGSDKDAIELFILAITKIKKTNSEEEHLKLNNVLAKCLEKKINAYYNNPSVSNEEMINTLNKFEYFSVGNKDRQKNMNLEHMKTLYKLKDLISNRNINEQVQKEPMPTFEELKDYSNKYEIIYGDNNQIKIIDKKTGQEVQDKKEEEKALFSLIWQMSAGIKEEYAFNDGAKAVYDYFANACTNNLTNTGNIDSIEIFKNSEFINYKHSQEIIANLFRSDFQAKFIDKFMRKRCEKPLEKTTDIIPLYSMEVAGTIVYGENENHKNK